MTDSRHSESIEKLLRLFKKHEVDFVICGGVAVNLHGHSRPTKDIDIAIDRTQGERILKALKEWGFYIPTLTPNHFMIEACLVICRLPPDRVDLVIWDGTEISWEEIRDTAVTCTYLDTEVPVASKETLIKTKTLYRRSTLDLSDAKALKEI